jgi:hypothetical protein
MYPGGESPRNTTIPQHCTITSIESGFVDDGGAISSFSDEMLNQ